MADWWGCWNVWFLSHNRKQFDKALEGISHRLLQHQNNFQAKRKGIEDRLRSERDEAKSPKHDRARRMYALKKMKMDERLLEGIDQHCLLIEQQQRMIEQQILQFETLDLQKSVMAILKTFNARISTSEIDKQIDDMDQSVLHLNEVSETMAKFNPTDLSGLDEAGLEEELRALEEESAAEAAKAIPLPPPLREITPEKEHDNDRLRGIEEAMHGASVFVWPSGDHPGGGHPSIVKRGALASRVQE